MANFPPETYFDVADVILPVLGVGDLPLYQLLLQQRLPHLPGLVRRALLERVQLQLLPRQQEYMIMKKMAEKKISFQIVAFYW
jgi:hypothetical protein